MPLVVLTAAPQIWTATATAFDSQNPPATLDELRAAVVHRAPVEDVTCFDAAIAA